MDAEQATPPCPSCRAPMAPGWLAFWNHTRFTDVSWSPTRPAPFVRMRKPDGSVRVLMHWDGDDARFAWRCPACGLLVVPGGPGAPPG